MKRKSHNILLACLFAFLIGMFSSNTMFSQRIVIYDDYVIKNYCLDLDKNLLQRNKINVNENNLCFNIIFDCKIVKDNSFYISYKINKTYPLSEIIFDNIDISQINKLSSFSFKMFLQDLKGETVFDTILHNQSLNAQFSFVLPEDVGYIPYRIDFEILPPKNTISNDIVQFVNTYNKQKTLIDSLDKILSTINPDSILIMESNDIRIDEIEQFVYNQKIDNIFNIIVDSSQEKKKYQSLKEKIKTYRNKIDFLFINSPQVAYKKGMYHLEIQDNNNALKYFSKGINDNYLFLPVSVKYIEFFFNKDDIDSVRDLIEKLEKHYLNNDKNIFFDACFRKHSELIGRAAVLNQKQNYNEAIVCIDKAKIICKILNFNNCSEQIHKEYSNAKKGLIDSYISVTKKAISKKLYDLADNYFLVTLNFQKDNQEFIPKYYAIEELASLLVNSKIKQINEAIKNHKAIEANSLFENLKIFTDTFPVSIFTTKIYNDIANKLPKELFNQYMELAKKEAKNKNSYKTLKYLNKAIEYGFNENLVNLYEANKTSNSPLKDSLNLFINNIEKIIKQKQIYTYNNQAQTKENESKVFDYSICNELNNKVNEYNKKANFYIIDKKFVFADILYDSIINIYNNFSECDIEISNVIENKKKIELFAQYQRQIDSAKHFVNNKNFEKGIKHYDEAEYIYTHNNIEENITNHIEMWNYIYYGENELILTAVTYYSKKYKLEEAAKLLNKLKDLNTNPDITKNEQETFAKFFAEEELKKSIQYKLANMLINQNDRFFKHFSKEYQKQLKSRR